MEIMCQFPTLTGLMADLYYDLIGWRCLLEKCASLLFKGAEGRKPKMQLLWKMLAIELKSAKMAVSAVPIAKEAYAMM
jgi:hypothetical protein